MRSVGQAFRDQMAARLVDLVPEDRQPVAWLQWSGARRLYPMEWPVEGRFPMALPGVNRLLLRDDMYQALRVLVSGRVLRSGVAEAMDATFELEDPV